MECVFIAVFWNFSQFCRFLSFISLAKSVKKNFILYYANVIYFHFLFRFFCHFTLLFEHDMSSSGLWIIWSVAGYLGKFKFGGGVQLEEVGHWEWSFEGYSSHRQSHVCANFLSAMRQAGSPSTLCLPWCCALSGPQDQWNQELWIEISETKPK